MAIDMAKAGRMALFAADAECLFDTVAHVDAHGIPVLPNSCTPPFGALLATDWQPVAQIRADDDLRVVQFLRTHFDIGQNNFFYGYLLRRIANATKDFAIGDYLAIVRGTIEAVEWLLDATATAEVFSAEQHHIAGLVPSGFYSIYKSMTLTDMNGHDLGNAASAIANIVNADKRPLTVVGHSLGSALVTYLTCDLARAVQTPSTNLAMFAVASPNPGDLVFRSKFQELVPNYNVVNWERDIVPRVPPPPYEPLHNGSPMQNVLALSESTPGIGPTPNNDPKCNHHAACYALMLDPTNAVGAALTVSFKCINAAAIAKTVAPV